MAIGGVVAGVQSALTGHGFWQAFGESVCENFVDAVVTSFAFTSVTFAISNVIGYFKCFKEGTLVQTEDGLKPIEDIQVGDKVLAYDEETGEQAYKPVLHLFRNKSYDWTIVKVNGTEIESTPGHKYYLPETKEWVSAENLKVGTKVLLSDGTYGIIKSVKSKHYNTPQTTYNFEVEDFHSYYVGNGVLVHNMGNGASCGGDFKKYSPDEIAKRGDITVEQFHRDVKPEILKIAPKNLGKNPDILLNRQNIVGLQSRINKNSFNTNRFLKEFIKRR
ncbi:MAG: Hint domain-containing protein [Clostridia bacterium]|nr:Hint domain-containing protein [Clostridia bacterium]